MFGGLAGAISGVITGIVLALAAPTGYMPFDPLDTVIIGLIYGGMIGLTIGFLSSLNISQLLILLPGLSFLASEVLFLLSWREGRKHTCGVSKLE